MSAILILKIDARFARLYRLVYVLRGLDNYRCFNVETIFYVPFETLTITCQDSAIYILVTSLLNREPESKQTLGRIA